ncbi:MAG: SDR family oxidoreductase [Cytophagaceae bacterium]|nr:SDR family oxidoreductase [Cytophagaceae bacterium]
MNLNLKEKVIIVSGGARGIGEGITRQLALEGAFPVIVGNNAEHNELALEKIVAAGGFGFTVEADLTKPEDCKKAIDATLEKFGVIHGLVNNAGFNDGVSLENGTYEEFVNSYHLNTVHYFLMAHYALPALKLTKGPILNIASKVAETGQGDTSGYAAANGARNALTREWAVELLKYKIRVNSVIVAECFTPMYDAWLNKFPNREEVFEDINRRIPLEKRMTTPEEIANMAVFLLSNRASHITGQLIHVDGGYVHLDRALL